MPLYLVIANTLFGLIKQVSNLKKNKSIWTGNADIVELLIKNGANVSSTNSRGQTPLIVAAKEGNLEKLSEKTFEIDVVNECKQSLIRLWTNRRYFD